MKSCVEKLWIQSTWSLKHPWIQKVSREINALPLPQDWIFLNFKLSPTSNTCHCHCVCEQKSRFINNLFQSSMHNWENHGKPHFFQSLSKSPTCRYLCGIMVTTAYSWSVSCELKSQKNFLFSFFCLISSIWWVFKFKIGKILLFVTYICRKMKWTLYNLTTYLLFSARLLLLNKELKPPFSVLLMKALPLIPANTTTTVKWRNRTNWPWTLIWPGDYGIQH